MPFKKNGEDNDIVHKGGRGQGSTKLVSVVSRIPDKLLMVRQMTLKITTKKVGPNP